MKWSFSKDECTMLFNSRLAGKGTEKFLYLCRPPDVPNEGSEGSNEGI